MPSSRKQLLLCLSITSAACDDAPVTCGPGGAGSAGIVVTPTNGTITYGAFTSGANNDCPANDGSTVTSLTIFAAQTDGTGTFTLCVPRPDQLGQGARALGLDQVGGDLRLVDVKGSTGGCTFTIDPTTPPTGTGHGDGVCAAGTDAAGFALTLDGTVTLRRTCGATVDSVTAPIAGTVAVVPR